MTSDQLKRRGFSLANRCCFCADDEEYIEHLLIHCTKIWALWSILVEALGIAWVTPRLVKDFIICWNKLPMRKDKRRISSTALCSLFWAIWKERNKVVFEDDVFSLSRLKNCFVHYSLCSWASLIPCSDSLIIRKLMPLAKF